MPTLENQAFIEQLVQAAQALNAFENQVEDSTRATKEGFDGIAGAAGGAVGGVKNALGSVGAFSAATSAADAFGSTGDLGLAGDVGRLGVLRGLSNFSYNDLPIGQLFAGVSGDRQTLRIAEGAAGRVSGVTEDLARFGINVPDDFRQRQIDIALEQERRADEERLRVAGEVADQTLGEGALDVGNVGGALLRGATGRGLPGVPRSLQEIEDLLRRWNSGFNGGGAGP